MLKLTEWTHMFDKDNAPIARCESGDVVTFVTRDCFDGQVTVGGNVELTVNYDQCNPATGPLYVEGAEPGDALVVDILDVTVAESGCVCSIPGEGPLWPTSEARVKILEVREGRVLFNDVSWPINPMIGVIGVAPAGDPIPSGWSFDGGGNMDSQKIVKGTSVWFPVRVPGALLAMGDLHATMGDGEVTATGLEIAGEVVVRVRGVKDVDIAWPVTETADAWYVNVDGETCDIAIDRGYKEMQRLISRAYGWDMTDAALYMSLQGFVNASQACLDPVAGDNTFTVGTPKLAGKPPLLG